MTISHKGAYEKIAVFILAVNTSCVGTL